MTDLPQKRVRVHAFSRDAQTGSDVKGGYINEASLFRCPNWIGSTNPRYRESLVLFEWATEPPSKSWMCYFRPIVPALECISAPDECEDLKEYVDPDAHVQELSVEGAINWCDRHGRELPDVLRQQQSEFNAQAAMDVTPRAMLGRAVGKGMSWERAKELGENHCQRNPFPGVRALAKIVGCSPSNMTKAIDHSNKLRALNAAHNARRSGIASQRVRQNSAVKSGRAF